MILRFRQVETWNSLEYSIAGSKEVLQDINKRLQDKKFSVCFKKEGKYQYNIMVNNIKEIVITVHINNIIVNGSRRFLRIDFHNKCKNTKMVNADEFRDTLENWFNVFAFTTTVIKTEKIKRSGYKRTGIYTIEEVLSKINNLDNQNDQINFDGDLIHMSSDRYHTFAEKGLKCVRCGIEGSFFAKESNDLPKYHFNLYAIDTDGKEVLMTKDHILPRSKGGKNEINNYQTMCTICNRKKGDTLE